MGFRLAGFPVYAVQYIWRMPAPFPCAMPLGAIGIGRQGAPLHYNVPHADSREAAATNAPPSNGRPAHAGKRPHGGASIRNSAHLQMNRLAKLLPPGNISLDVSVTSKKRVFEQAGLLFENNHGVARATVTDNLFARESLGSTGLGAGVAIPHGRIKGLKQPLAAFMRLAEPIPFESPDGKPVSLLIFLLVPEQATQQHLEILSEIAQLLSDRDMREGLAALPTPDAIHQLLVQWHP